MPGANSMDTLKGQIALVTGAGVGIGRATALALAKEGADVALHCRASREGAEQAARQIEAMGRRAMVVSADLTNSVDVTQCVAQVERQFDRIDILVNNAGGILGRHPLVDMPEQFFHDVINVNVLSTLLCCQAAARGMIARKRGAIVNMTSLAAHNGGGPGASVYAASKAAIQTLTKAWSKELAPHGVRMNAV